MRRTLMILGILFLALWIAGLFYPSRTASIHVSLIVALLFFMRSLMATPQATAKSSSGGSVAGNR